MGGGRGTELKTTGGTSPSLLLVYDFTAPREKEKYLLSSSHPGVGIKERSEQSQPINTTLSMDYERNPN